MKEQVTFLSKIQNHISEKTRVILNFAQECYYLKNKVGVVDFTKARGPFGPLGFKTLPLLGHLQNLLLPLYF